MDEQQHVWGGIEQPSHVKNIRGWMQQVDDKLLNHMQSTVEYMYRMTYNKRGVLSEDQEDIINVVARETLDKMYDIAREHGIEVWHPTADNYEF